MPELRRVMTDAEQAALLALSFAGCGAGMVQMHRYSALASEGAADIQLASLGAAPLLLAVAMSWRALQRLDAPRAGQLTSQSALQTCSTPAR
jgi:hypothetical protein